MTLPILDFLTKRMTEYDSTYEHRPGTAFSDLFMQPVSLIVQPLRDEANVIQTNQSLRRILDEDDPDAYFEDSVDENVENYFVYRRAGSKASTVVRVYYRQARDIDFSAGSLQASTSDGFVFVNSSPIVLSAQQMSTQIEDDFFYFDATFVADGEGVQYNVDAGAIIEVDDPNSAKAENKFAVSSGADRETNTELIDRTRNSIGVRDLNVGKGFNAIMFENFLNSLTEVQPIGFGDPEMMRDIAYNYHVGGRIDGFVKTPAITDGTFDVVGLTIDPSRRLPSSTNLLLEGTTEVPLGRNNIDITDNLVRMYDAEVQERAAVFYSYIDLEAGVDLSVNQYIRLKLDNRDPINIRISGSIPDQTQIGEIVNRINTGTGEEVAFTAINPTVVSRRSTGNVDANGSVKLIDPTPRIFTNVQPGDLVYVTYGDNENTYTVDTVDSENQILVESSLPFPNSMTDMNYRIVRVGTYLKILSQIKSIDSLIELSSPTSGTDALTEALGLLPGTHSFYGRGPEEYLEGVGFETNLVDGTVKRILGTYRTDGTKGEVDNNLFFSDPVASPFGSVQPGDVLTITSSSDPDWQRDYRIKEVINTDIIRVDSFFPFAESDIEYTIRGTNILNNSMVYVTFDFNPMSIDIGNQVVLDEYGRVRGIRSGRDDQTITDMAYLYTVQIELIDPVSGEPLGQVLEGKGGYGRGGYGRGGYGVGSRAQYRTIVNEPTLRFSAYEDSYISIDTAFLGQSFRVTYKYVPEIVQFQAFADSDTERVLDAHVLMRHFLPGVVDITAEYTTDPTNASTPDKATVVAAIKKFIETTTRGQPIDSSDIVDVIYEQIDPNRTRNARVKSPIEMYGTIYNTDNTLTIVESTDVLEVPEEEIPPFTTAPLSPRIVHWIAGEINLTEIQGTSTGVI